MLLLSIHSILAATTKIDELAITKTEADELAKAIAEVQKHYPVAMSPKIQAWVQLAMIGASVYGPRGIMYVSRVRSERQEAKPAPQQQAPRPTAQSEPPSTKGALTPSQLFGGLNFRG